MVGIVFRTHSSIFGYLKLLGTTSETGSSRIGALLRLHGDRTEVPVALVRRPLARDPVLILREFVEVPFGLI